MMSSTVDAERLYACAMPCFDAAELANGRGGGYVQHITNLTKFIHAQRNRASMAWFCQRHVEVEVLRAVAAFVALTHANPCSVN